MTALRLDRELPDVIYRAEVAGGLDDDVLVLRLDHAPRQRDVLPAKRRHHVVGADAELRHESGIDLDPDVLRLHAEEIDTGDEWQCTEGLLDVASDRVQLRHRVLGTGQGERDDGDAPEVVVDLRTDCSLRQPGREVVHLVAKIRPNGRHVRVAARGLRHYDGQAGHRKGFDLVDFRDRLDRVFNRARNKLLDALRRKAGDLSDHLRAAQGDLGVLLHPVGEGR